MHSTADLRLPFAIRPLTPNLGAEILGAELAKGIMIWRWCGTWRTG